MNLSFNSPLHFGLQSARVFSTDVIAGLRDVGHRTAVLVGLLVLGAALYLHHHSEFTQELEQRVLTFLQERSLGRMQPQQLAQLSDKQLSQELAEPTASQRATAADPAELTRQQGAIARWLSKRYSVAPEPISRLVQEAWVVGKKAKIEPTLILSVIAIESRFNPFAESHVGAQGLMQVMTRIHDEKYDSFGGDRAAFDPVSNLRVGVQVLRDCIAQAGSLEGGLKYYVGAANLPHDGGYANKVLTEQSYLREVMAGRQVPTTVPQGKPTLAEGNNNGKALLADAGVILKAADKLDAKITGQAISKDRLAKIAELNQLLEQGNPSAGPPAHATPAALKLDASLPQAPDSGADGSNPSPATDNNTGADAAPLTQNTTNTSAALKG